MRAYDGQLAQAAEGCGCSRTRHADAHANLAVALAGLGNLEQAREHFAEALRMDPNHERARQNIAALNQ